MSRVTDQSAQDSRKEWLRVWTLPIIVVAVGFLIAWAGVEPPPPSTIRLASGAEGGSYHAFALQYREVLAGEGFELDIVETAGSVENLELLRRGDVDVAFVQGGIAQLPQDGEVVSGLASIFFEPVWVFQRRDNAVDQLRQLKGRRLLVGGEGSGTRALATRLLEANGLGAGDVELLDGSGALAARQLLAGEADAAFFVTSGRSSYLPQLLASDDISLLSFRRQRAYCNRFRFLSPLVLGEGAIDLGRNLPEQDHQLVASAAMLVAGNELHHALVPMLLDTAEKVHKANQAFREESQLPAARFNDLPIEDDARHYLEHGPSFLHRYLGFWAASTIDRLKILLLPFITLLIPIFKAAPPIYRWRIRSKIYRWYEDLKRVDDVMAEKVPADVLTEHIQHLKTLEKELTEVQVPLSYMDEFYRLRVHIELIVTQLEGRLAHAEPHEGKDSRTAS